MTTLYVSDKLEYPHNINTFKKGDIFILLFKWIRSEFRTFFTFFSLKSCFIENNLSRLAFKSFKNHTAN